MKTDLNVDDRKITLPMQYHKWRLVAPPLAPVGGLECRRTVGMSKHFPVLYLTKDGNVLRGRLVFSVCLINERLTY